jgi:type IV pilus assembly protein PilB
VLLVSAQRLLRKLCTECRAKFTPPRERLIQIGLKEDEMETATFQEAKGCARCSHGYKGRFAILETMRMREDIRRVVIEGGSALDVRGKALEHDMITLRRCALLNAMRGKTSIEEVLTMTLDEG